MPRMLPKAPPLAKSQAKRYNPAARNQTELAMATPRKPKDQHLKTGRPTAYRPEFAAEAAKLCQAGLTDYEIAHEFGVSTVTINAWKKQFPEFLNALKVGKGVADERVVRSLYHKALGYTYEAEEVFQHQGEIVRAKVLKHVPPDTASMIFWLKNRQKDQWRDVHNHEVRVATEYAQLSDEELVARMQASAKLLLEAPKVIEHDEDEAVEK